MQSKYDDIGFAEKVQRDWIVLDVLHCIALIFMTHDVKDEVNSNFLTNTQTFF